MTTSANNNRPFRNALRWCWRAFRRLPLVMQLCFAAASMGAIIVGVFVGNMGLALMGTAFGISGMAVGAVIGALSVLLPWMAKHTIAAKRSGR
ncbi:hypothetical protein [Pseudogemmobacter sonorensis]|uniref:hypothetical protein n=1 Tax=Pseudogemmobacter sonorensis TaxID=2989681 RepID=UPI0036A632EE